MRASASGWSILPGSRSNRSKSSVGMATTSASRSFSGGAWRFAAVHLGGMERLFELLHEHLRRTGRGQDPHQAARFGEAAIAVETAKLWVERAAAIAEAPAGARAPTRSWLSSISRALRSSAPGLTSWSLSTVGGASGLHATRPIERVSRDLATYLRQPGPDRALTSAAAWILEREPHASELWR